MWLVLTGWGRVLGHETSTPTDPSQWSAFPKARISSSLVFLYRPRLPPSSPRRMLKHPGWGEPLQLVKLSQALLCKQKFETACFLLELPTSRSQTTPFRAWVCWGTSQLPAPSFTRGRHVGILLTLWQSEHRTKEEHLREKFLEIVQALQERWFCFLLFYCCCFSWLCFEEMK